MLRLSLSSGSSSEAAKDLTGTISSISTYVNLTNKLHCPPTIPVLPAEVLVRLGLLLSALSLVCILLWFLPSVEILSHRGRDSNWFWVDKEGSSGELHPYLGDSFKPAYSFLGCHESRCSIGVYMILYRIWYFYFRLVESILQYHFVRSLLRLSYSVKTSLLAIHRRINCD